MRRRVVITGASSGIGRVTAEKFAEGESDLALVARSEGRLQELARYLAAAGSEAHWIVADLGEEGEPRRAIEPAASKLGALFQRESEPARGPGGLWQSAERAAAGKSRKIE